MIRRVTIIFFVLAGLCAFQCLLARADAQTPLRRLTTTGDLLEFVWSPDGSALYVTRAGQVISRSRTQQQLTGDLSQVNVADATSRMLAQNANGTRAPIVGDEIAFTRLNRDGTSHVIVYNPQANQELDEGEITFGAEPQWSREGGTLYVEQDGKMFRSTRTERVPTFDAQSFPTNARVSSSGDRVAFLDEQGLWVTQGNTRNNVARTQNDVNILPNFVWSNSGDTLAYIVTHNGFDPEVWLFDANLHTNKSIAQGNGLEHWANLAWSPDGAFVIFTRTPTGSTGANTSEIWRARADGSALRALTRNNAEETLPQYAPDGKSIAFLRNGDVWVMELNGDGLPQADTNVSSNAAQETTPDFKTPQSVDTQRTPPATIRVRHDAANSCRTGVPVGGIDTLDFETYVKRVVPSEVFSTWDADALETQAVAARTYAWFWILQHTGSAYDVTDSTAYQYMCDTRVASTDSATDATRGQYLDYQGYMVFAAYGAENSDPTLTNTFSNPYLLAVDDPVGFMKTRSGNGIGYSQWGAQRWATQYGWNYQQILRHYYSNVTIQEPAGSGMDLTPPSGAIVSPWSEWGITSNRVHFIVNASDDASGISSIDLNAQYTLNGTHNEIITTLNGSEREYTWDVSALPNQTNIIVTPFLHDVAGNSSTGVPISFDLDRRNPQGTMTTPATTTNQTVTLALNASDLGGTLAGMMFSNDWEWQGENQNVESNSGSVVSDPDALNGSALRGLVGTNPAGAWYGPYTNVLPTNQAYRAYFRLKTDNVTTTDEIALLDVVTDGGANILGLKSIRGTDLKTANQYQEFYVDFYYTGFNTNAPEFRVAYRASASLWLDRILVVSYPMAYASTTQWTLSNGQGNKRVVGKFLDSAGNVSPDTISTLFYGQNPPPTLSPRVWLPYILRSKQ